MSILDVLDIASLINLANAQVDLRDLIGHHYLEHKYAVHQKIMLFKPDLPYASASNPPSIRLADDHILFTRAEDFSSFLQSYGSMVTKVDLHGRRSSDSKMREIVEQIRGNCTKSVTEITLRQLNGEIFIRLEPFPLIHSVTIDGVRSAEEIRIDYLFPRMRSLNVKLNDESDIREQLFPHMTQLKLQLGPKEVQHPSIERILRLNPQIVSFSCGNFLRAPTVQALASDWLLPNMRQLALVSHRQMNYFAREGPFHFTHVDEFKLSLSNQAPERPHEFPFRFDGLKTLIFRALAITNAWIDFFVMNEALESVQMPIGEPNHAQLSHLIERLPRLRHISAIFYSTSNVNNSIVRIMNEDNRIDSVSITVVSDDALDVILDHLPTGWQFVGKVDEWEEDRVAMFERQRD